MTNDHLFDLSIITVSQNHRDFLVTCLGSLHEQRARTSFEIVVVDNTCTDGSTEMVETEYPYVRLVRSRHPAGYAANVNQGLRLAEGRYPLIMNPDIELLPGALDALVDFMDTEGT